MDFINLSISVWHLVTNDVQPPSPPLPLNNEYIQREIHIYIYIYICMCYIYFIYLFFDFVFTIKFSYTGKSVVRGFIGIVLELTKHEKIKESSRVGWCLLSELILYNLMMIEIKKDYEYQERF